jgi:hypothetical protein
MIMEATGSIEKQIQIAQHVEAFDRHAVTAITDMESMLGTASEDVSKVRAPVFLLHRINAGVMLHSIFCALWDSV